MLIRRSRFVVFDLVEVREVDWQSLLSGTVKSTKTSNWVATSAAAKGTQHQIDGEALVALRSLSHDWIPIEEAAQKTGLDQAHLREYVRCGILISDSSDPAERSNRQREDRLETSAWSAEAAFLHYTSVRRFARGKAESPECPPLEHRPENVSSFVSEYGAPPVEAHVRSGCYTKLPCGGEQSPLESLLRRRKTVRAFDETLALPISQFSRLLRETFGFHGISDFGSGLKLFKRTSPSGGSLHPIEAYVMARKVEDLESGLYHYSSLEHGFAKLGDLSAEEIRPKAIQFCAGQEFSAGAHALVILTARFDREFWKYRKMERAYSVVMMDAGHLSQTFYLLATELGLAVFLTAAIDLASISEALELEDPCEVPVAVLGCGLADRYSEYGTLLRDSPASS